MCKFVISACVRSDVGRIRNNNEDNYRLLDVFRKDVEQNNSEASINCTDQKAIFSVCDGMGGEECGEIASLIAVQNIRSTEKKTFKEIAIEDAVSINAMVCKAAIEKNISRMGSTMANLYIDAGTAIAANVGDSRVYFYRKGILKQLTMDHDEAARLVNMGVLTIEQAQTDKRRHQLTQYLGMNDEEIVPEPYFCDEIKISDGDRFLLVSDGVTDDLTDDDIAKILNKGLLPKETVDTIVDTALERSGHDNITAIVVDIKENAKSFWKVMRGWLHGDRI